MTMRSLNNGLFAISKGKQLLVNANYPKIKICISTSKMEGRNLYDINCGNLDFESAW